MKTVTMPDGKTFYLKLIREWKDLKVIEMEMPEGIDGISLPWKNPGEYRIFINRDLDESEKLEVFIHEMIHIYRGDHEKKGAKVDKIESEVHRITQNIIGSLTNDDLSLKE